ncbi:MAG: 6-carboxytetrahydropterin synthase [Nitrososphaerota archaeon]|nr:6-carboxytetrahydropterin synthase [Nitrososphaerota archaeon]MDG6978531.1 6-carboxytetrahydropterin synthase [Nitrososphaerota archaeon]MDG7005664.1 6-carboxytetrahydropterin synthase [Nitrososphaerota archaeon]MDG7021087.1 6-carboxytetrahydropterin synthase [Nitrososphaerota archaeon]MDG7022012.1 6-carboxytetrahydropterin synthase [Nitrososphaerota archaeon]
MRDPARRDIAESSQILRQLESLDDGGYARSFVGGGAQHKTGLLAGVATLLDSLGLRYESGAPLGGGSKLKADFVVEGRTALFVGRELSPSERRAAIASGRRCVAIEISDERSDAADSGLRVSRLERRGREAPGGRLQTIFLDDPSFNFDYAHILPKTEKCSVMHGHTSSALVEIVGRPQDGMVVDFNDAKPIIKEAISDLDHKLFINERYVTGRTQTHVDLAFYTVHGEFSLHVPRETTVLMDGEATVENLARELLRRIAPRMPGNVDAVGVYVYEGLNKGTQLLSRLRSREAERRRKR